MLPRGRGVPLGSLTYTIALSLVSYCVMKKNAIIFRIFSLSEKLLAVAIVAEFSSKLLIFGLSKQVFFKSYASMF